MKHCGLTARTMNLAEVMLGDLDRSAPEGAGLVETLMDVLSEPGKPKDPEQAARRRPRQRDALNRALASMGALTRSNASQRRSTG